MARYQHDGSDRRTKHAQHLDRMGHPSLSKFAILNRTYRHPEHDEHV
jgi:hypothetical protein